MHTYMRACDEMQWELGGGGCLPPECWVQHEHQFQACIQSPPRCLRLLYRLLAKLFKTGLNAVWSRIQQQIWQLRFPSAVVPAAAVYELAVLISISRVYGVSTGQRHNGSCMQPRPPAALKCCCCCTCAIDIVWGHVTTFSYHMLVVVRADPKLEPGSCLR